MRGFDLASVMNDLTLCRNKGLSHVQRVTVSLTIPKHNEHASGLDGFLDPPHL